MTVPGKKDLTAESVPLGSEANRCEPNQSFETEKKSETNKGSQPQAPAGDSPTEPQDPYITDPQVEASILAYASGWYEKKN